MPSRKTELSAYAILALVMVFWAGNAIVGRAVRNDIPPFFLTFVRWSGALLVLMPFAWARLKADRQVLLAAWKPVLALGLIGVAAFNTLLYLGLHYTTAANSMLLQALTPTFVLAANFVVFRLRATPIQIAGVMLSTIGVAFIVFRGDLGSILRMQLGLGDGLILIAVIGWGIYTSLLRVRPAVHALSFLTATFFIAMVVSGALAATEWRQVAAIDWRPEIFAAFAYVILFPSIAAYGLFNLAVSMIGAGNAGQMLNLLPLFGAFLAALLLKEPLHGYHYAGMVLILGGILSSAILGRPRPTP